MNDFIGDNVANADAAGFSFTNESVVCHIVRELQYHTIVTYTYDCVVKVKNGKVRREPRHPLNE